MLLLAPLIFKQFLLNRFIFPHLSVFINFGVWVVGDNWRIEEVEEAVCLDLFGDSSDTAFGLVLLLLLNLFHSEIFALLPIN